MKVKRRNFSDTKRRILKGIGIGAGIGGGMGSAVGWAKGNNKKAILVGGLIGAAAGGFLGLLGAKKLSKRDKIFEEFKNISRQHKILFDICDNKVAKYAPIDSETRLDLVFEDDNFGNKVGDVYLINDAEEKEIIRYRWNGKFWESTSNIDNQTRRVSNLKQELIKRINEFIKSWKDNWDNYSGDSLSELTYTETIEYLTKLLEEIKKSNL